MGKRVWVELEELVLGLLIQWEHGEEESSQIQDWTKEVHEYVQDKLKYKICPVFCSDLGI